MGDATDESRSRGILSDADRRFLRGDYEGKSSNARAQRKNAIRERTHEALLDFNPLLEHLPGRIRREIFNIDTDERGGEARVRTAVTSGFAFMYLGLSETAAGDSVELLEKTVSRAIKMAYERRGESTTSVDVSIDVELGGPLDDLDKPLDELPDATLQQLMLSDRITLDEYTKAIKEQA